MRARPFALSLLALALVTCASVSTSPTRPEESLGDPRAEIARLQARIGFLRDQLKLPATPPSGVSTGTPGWQRCREIGAAADEICYAAIRICALAEQLADDDARAACSQAREDCKRARATADSCK
jgi:hypothetical protein